MDVHKGGGGPAHVDRGGGQKRDFFVDVINGWPLNSYKFCSGFNSDYIWLLNICLLNHLKTN